MKKAIIFVCIILGSAWLCGCATVGTNFRSENVKDIFLGTTTTSGVIQMFGEPQDKILKSLGAFESTIYKYVYAEGTPSKGVARALLVEFVRDTVNGYIFSSAFEEDITDFDGKVRNSIENNKTTKEEILSLLRQPSGKVLFNTNLIFYKFGNEANSKMHEGIAEVWTYHYSYALRKNDLFVHPGRTLLIYFDTTERAVDKFYTETLE